MKKSTSRRARAVIAGAAVLGLGAAGTLAVWVDSEFLTATFTSQAGFWVESAAAEDGPYSSHGSESEAAQLNFDFPAGGLEVGEPVSAEFWLRMASETTGIVSVAAPEMEFGELDGRIEVTVTQGGCTGTVPGRELQSGTLEELSPAPEAFTLPAGVGENPGRAQPVCITATLNSLEGLPAGEYSTGQVTWEFLVAEAEI